MVYKDKLTLGQICALRICYECAIPHYENCPECFGLGHWENGTPIPFLSLLEERKSVPCPYCSSTKDGLPDFRRLEE